MLVNLSPSRIEFIDPTRTISFVRMDMLRAEEIKSARPEGNQAPRPYAVRIYLDGQAKATYGQDHYDVDLRPGVITNQPTWTNDKGGVQACLAAIAPIIRAYPVSPTSPGAKNSIEYDGGELQLVNDTLAPGNNMVYGTDGFGVRAWKADLGAQAITGLTGDGTATGPGNVAFTLSATGVVAGAYTNADVTVDAKGRILSIANGTAAVDPGYKDHFLLMGG